MPDCHKCPHNGKRSDACIDCRGPADTNHKGKTHISIDSQSSGESRSDQSLGEIEATCSALWHHGNEPRLSRVHPDAVKVATAFLSMTEVEFVLVKALIKGESMSSLARKAGLTRAAVSAQVKRLAEKHPFLSFMRR